ncbi:hypothetical protein FA10DRAFT_291542 [Acaromyces ingoldii]|uniref:Uncharacterized protein n=1 Tax=Acaromyces ingoldii TaxID=215250 RepID=A0A316YYU5_9BASI|nr:hypothetical protein FA10DRAFT_291542 [Acaromyces ingoldii]PWN94282.1 hypothetical protein FA10DRAFT_291542 [Acaromyces ingoldii]
MKAWAWATCSSSLLSLQTPPTTMKLTSLIILALGCWQLSAGLAYPAGNQQGGGYPPWSYHPSLGTSWKPSENHQTMTRDPQAQDKGKGKIATTIRPHHICNGQSTGMSGTCIKMGALKIMNPGGIIIRQTGPFHCLTGLLISKTIGRTISTKINTTTDTTINTTICSTISPLVSIMISTTISTIINTMISTYTDR